MILVAESGSTKTQWNIIRKEGIEVLVSTPGMNPYHLSLDEIVSMTRPVSAGMEIKEIDTIYFFGAGCATNQQKEKIGKALFTIFGCNKIIVDSDLIAACLSLAGDKPSIIGLLGTGSNSCLWNGSTIHQQTPSLGYILGDEGGGVSIGKQLVSDFLKNMMPLDLRILFIEKYDVSTEIVLERVYRMPMANRYLAGFAPFIEDHIDHPYCQKLIFDQINSFVVRNILAYQSTSEYPISFCGSIAHFHRDIVLKVCGIHNIKVNQIVKEPILGLSLYLSKKMN